MRSVYQNVGETGDLIGLYPYAPAARHAARPADPRSAQESASARRRDARNLVRDAILQSFYALRETFLEELDLEEPDHPLLISSGRRAKSVGFDGQRARAGKNGSAAHQDRVSSPDPRIDQLLAELMQKEEQTAKPWRQPAASAPAAPANGRAS